MPLRHQGGHDLSSEVNSLLAAVENCVIRTAYDLLGSGQDPTQNPRGKIPGTGRRVQCGAQPNEASNTLTGRPATYHHASDSRAGKSLVRLKRSVLRFFMLVMPKRYQEVYPSAALRDSAQRIRRPSALALLRLESFGAEPASLP